MRIILGMSVSYYGHFIIHQVSAWIIMTAGLTKHEKISFCLGLKLYLILFFSIITTLAPTFFNSFFSAFVHLLTSWIQSMQLVWWSEGRKWCLRGTYLKTIKCMNLCVQEIDYLCNTVPFLSYPEGYDVILHPSASNKNEYQESLKINKPGGKVRPAP
jgi:hypothetical protein